MVKTALIVDDSRLARLTLKRLLMKYDIEVSEAEGVLDAERWITHNMLPDIIFMDIMMPELDGYDGLARLRQDPDTRDVPVIMYSGDISEESRRKARDGGATGYLPKPADASRLDHLLSALKKRARPERAEAPVAKPVAPVRAPEPAYQSEPVPETVETTMPSFATNIPAAVVPPPASAQVIVQSADSEELRQRLETLEIQVGAHMRGNAGHKERDSVMSAEIERLRRDVTYLQQQLGKLEQRASTNLVLGSGGLILSIIAVFWHLLR
ncbi:MAG: response regulator [Cardiobacteriaceae bacterium]|nr:response regulator [Cardiobacteriaceae bacterium]